jgi:hypothetical protein
MVIQIGSGIQIGQGIIVKGDSSGTPTISGPLTAFTAGQPGSTSATVSPPGTAVTILNVTNGGVPDTLAAHGITHDGFGTFTTTGAIL